MTRSENSNSSAFVSFLSRSASIVLDGGLATELTAQGHDLSSVLWSSELLRSNPRAIVDAHRAYFDAGALISISASYNASRAGFHQFGIEADEADRLIASAVDLAGQARDEFANDNPGVEKRWIAASIGPYGAVLNDGSEYVGDYGVSQNVLRQFHAQRLQLLDRAGADVLACETIPSLDEAIVLAELLAGVATPAWVSFSCKNGQQICDGTPIAEVCSHFRTHSRVVALGVNCTRPEYISSLITEIRMAAAGKTIVVYPNSGETYSADNKDWSGIADTNGIETFAGEWLAAGAKIIGGCCRIGPLQIKALVTRMKAAI